MPLRVIGYDGAEYRAQLLSKQAVHYPVVTLVLYFGHKQRWSGPQMLKERLDIPKEFDEYVNDYKIHVFEIAFMDKEYGLPCDTRFGCNFQYHPLRRMTCSKRTLWCKTPILTQFYVSVGWSY